MATAFQQDLARVTTTDDVVRAKTARVGTRAKTAKDGGQAKTTANVASSGTKKTEASGSDRFTQTNYFPTMIFQYDVEGAEDLNKTLLDLTYAEREGGVAVNKSNTAELGSWHSATALHKKPDYEPLMLEINSALSRISDDLTYSKDQVLKVTSMWSIINPPGNGNRAHVHPNSLWSGVYYVHAPEGAGKIEFIDPRTVIIMNQPKYEMKKKRPRDCWAKVNIKPVPGRMVIFPAWLYHGVASNLSKEKGRAGDRVIISFNINQVKK
ncbi:MAG: TIGR02466 family protein [Candidatus Binatia bacterium]